MVEKELVVTFMQPFCTFCVGLSIVPGGITLQREECGKETGEAFIELASKDDIDKALARDRNEIQHRYVLVCG